MIDRGHRVAFLISRLLLAPIFIYAAVGHLISPHTIAARLEAAPLGWLATMLAPSTPLVVLSGVAMLVGGIALLIGFQTRLAAIGLALVLIPITVTVQVGNPNGWGPFFKNVAIFGGLLQFALLGAPSWSVDGLLARRTPTSRAAITAGVVGLLVVASLSLPALASTSSTRSDDATWVDRRESHDSPEAAEKSPKTRRVAFLVQAPRPLRNVLDTARELRKEGAEVTVMACGQSVGSLVVGGMNETLANEASADGIRVLACGLTLRELSIDAGSLAPSVGIVPNGLLEMLRLQEEGYRTVDL